MKKIISLLALLSVMGWSACGDPDPLPQNREVPSRAEPSLQVLPTIELESEPVAFVDDRVQRIRGLKPGEVVARLTIPALDMDSYPIRFGISQEVLAQGPGLYPGAAAPGEGNFSMAGHRITPVGPWDHGPFRYVDTLKKGDIAKVVYEGKTYVYEFQRNVIIDPTDVSILRDNKADLTFTACHPPGYSTERIVAQWSLVDG